MDAFVARLNPVTLSLAPPTIAPAGVGAPYTMTFTASGGNGSGYSFSATGLPAGLTLSSGGVLTGTAPATPGTYAFTVSARDSANNSGSRQYTLVVAVPNATPQPASTRAPMGNPNVAPATHTPRAGVAGMPTPLPQPVRH